MLSNREKQKKRGPAVLVTAGPSVFSRERRVQELAPRCLASENSTGSLKRWMFGSGRLPSVGGAVKQAPESSPDGTTPRGTQSMRTLTILAVALGLTLAARAADEPEAALGHMVYFTLKDNSPEAKKRI